MSDANTASCPGCRLKDEQITELTARVADFEANRDARRAKVRKALALMMEAGDDISDILESIQQGGNDLGDFLFPTP